MNNRPGSKPGKRKSSDQYQNTDENQIIKTSADDGASIGNPGYDINDFFEIDSFQHGIKQNPKRIKDKGQKKRPFILHDYRPNMPENIFHKHLFSLARKILISKPFLVRSDDLGLPEFCVQSPRDTGQFFIFQQMQH